MIFVFGVSRSCGSQVNPIPAFRLVEIRAAYDVLKDATVLLDRSDRADVVVVARHQYAADTKSVAGNRERQTKDRRGIALPPELRNHDVADVATYA